MRSFKTEGVILKRRNFGEADRILTVFTLHKGKISVIAKGVRRITSRRAGNVELLNRVSMYLYQAKGMPILTEAESLNNFSKLKEDLKLSTYVYHIIEVVEKLTAENQENRILYEHLVRVFEAKILSNQGFVSFREVRDFGDVGEVLKKIEVSSWDGIEEMKIDEKQAIELEWVLRYHLERVIEGSLKSMQFLRKI